VDAHIAEIMAKSRFHKTSRGRIERAAGGLQGVMHEGRRLARCQPAVWLGMELLVFFVAHSAFTVNLRRGGGDGDGRIWQAQDLIGDSVGFGFKRVVDGADFELALEGGRFVGQTAECCPITGVAHRRMRTLRRSRTSLI
jgi:hypothetical protein